MSNELEIAIADAVEVLRTQGFERAYISAAVNSYRENLEWEREKASETGLRLAVSRLARVTSVTSVDDPAPKESIGWQHRLLKQDEPAPNGWVIVSD
ncbi:MAG: hypothetical protein AB7E69_16120 [Sphingomonadales bacterium]